VPVNFHVLFFGLSVDQDAIWDDGLGGSKEPYLYKKFICAVCKNKPVILLNQFHDKRMTLGTIITQNKMKILITDSISTTEEGGDLFQLWLAVGETRSLKDWYLVVRVIYMYRL